MIVGHISEGALHDLSQMEEALQNFKKHLPPYFRLEQNLESEKLLFLCQPLPIILSLANDGGDDYIEKWWV